MKFGEDRRRSRKYAIMAPSLIPLNHHYTTEVDVDAHISEYNR